MKIKFNIDLNPESFRGFKNDSTIVLRFEYCTHEDFYNWLDKNSKRIQELCEKFGWSYDVGHLDKIVHFSK